MRVKLCECSYNSYYWQWILVALLVDVGIEFVIIMLNIMCCDAYYFIILHAFYHKLVSKLSIQVSRDGEHNGEQKDWGGAL